jgi:uncharacterized protein YqjF (DUF2071 family)
VNAASETVSITRPFLTAEWRYLVMFNYRVPPDVLAPFVPAGTVLDAWQGETWLSVVGFRFLSTRVLGLPIPFHRNFLEVNLRFYVRPRTDVRRAVVFLREIVPRRAIALTARLLYNEPYVVRRMRAVAPVAESVAPGRVQYAWHHAGRWNTIGVTAAGAPTPIRPGSAEEFIAEHYWGYTAQRDGSTVEYQVEHPTWHVWSVTEATFDVDVSAEYGARFAPLLTQPPASVFLADGSPVRVGRPHVLMTGASSPVA